MPLRTLQKGEEGVKYQSHEDWTYNNIHHQEAKIKEARAKEKELLSDSGESEDEDNGM